ncbi:hypothetical protein BDV25DRAFT_140670 [Aspergillus avenaceus]|uniref:Transcription factor domain-containing protein n=1 Tax=Aspergillus avenaceus TaxID=36643 RepID=A0A5N6TT71_ASPAV|nr:hypothetical protein BDV25DRAFT_140670 [Aspergillus avenaceus]
MFSLIPVGCFSAGGSPIADIILNSVYNYHNLSNSSQADLPYSLTTPLERLGDHERLIIRLQSHATPSLDLAFEGFDMLANLTEDIPDFWGMMNPVMTPDALPILPSDGPQLENSLDSSYLPRGSGSAFPGYEGSLLSTHELEDPISPSDLAILHRKYFDVFYPVLPILSQARFHREWAQGPGSPRIRGLSYAVALIELCERDDNETHLMSLNAFQALLFIVRYELTKKHFVHQNPARHNDADIGLIRDIRHPVELEEIQRSFWSL